MIQIIKILLLSLLNLNSKNDEPVRLQKTSSKSSKFTINWKIVLIIVSWVLFVLLILLFAPGNDSAISYNTPLA